MPRPRTHAATCLTAALAAHSATADTTWLKAQVYDRTLATWGDRVRIDPTINGEVRVRFTLSTNTADVTALSGLNFQPLLSRWTAVDHAVLGVTSGNYNTLPTVDADFATGEEFGRVAAFAFGNILPINALVAHQNVIAGINTLRIAQTTVTNAPGDGATLNNRNGSGGIPITQNITGPGRPPDAPPIVDGTTDIVVYGFKFSVGGPAVDRNPDDPTADLTINSTAFSTGGTIRWYWPLGPIEPPPPDTIVFVPAFVDIVPAPSAACALLALLAGQTRRARRPTQSTR